MGMKLIYIYFIITDSEYLVSDKCTEVGPSLINRIFNVFTNFNHF